MIHFAVACLVVVVVVVSLVVGFVEDEPVGTEPESTDPFAVAAEIVGTEVAENKKKFAYPMVE